MSPSLARRALFCAVFAVHLLPTIVHAQPSSPKLLVLQSGRIVRGDLQPTRGGYLVIERTGQIFIPFTQVQFTADDLSDAYQKLSASVREPTAATHLSLARWCVEQKLYSQARSEAKAALRLEPNRPDARRMLARVDQILNPVAKPKPLPPRERMSPAIVNADALLGLKRLTVAEFTQKVQPLFKRKCGNASCHGGNRGGKFRLAGIHGLGFNSMTQKNLAATMTLVDADRPGSSRLLSVFQSANRSHSARLFSGTSGLRQWKTISEWVNRAAKDKQSAQIGTRPAPRRQPVTPASGQGNLVPFSSSVPPSFSVPSSSPPVRLAPDPFDPEVFNRMQLPNRRKQP